MLAFFPLTIDRAAAAQNPTVIVGSVSGLAGSRIDLPVNFAVGTTGVSALEFDLILPLGVTSPNPPLVAAGSAASAASKSVSAGVQPNGDLRVLVFGLNQNVIGNGPLALVRLNIAADIALGAHPVGITGLVASDAGGHAVASSGATGTVEVTASGRFFIPSVVEDAEVRTNLGINNLSGDVANVQITVSNTGGSALGNKSVSVPPNGMVQINRVIQDIVGNGTAGVRGSISLDSGQSITAWASLIDNSTNDPSLLTSGMTGSARLLIPSAANTRVFTSSLVIMNLGQTTGLISIKAYGTNGVVLGQTQTPLSIAALGTLYLENVLAELGITENYGPIEINSTNGSPLMAASRVASQNGTGGFFEGLNFGEASLHQIIPHAIDTLELRTNLGINNTSGETAQVDLQLVNQIGRVAAVLHTSVPPGGMTQINNVLRQLTGSSGVTNMEGYLQLDSTQPIIAWVSEIDNSTNDPGFAVSKAAGASHLLVPSATSVDPFKSSLVVVNAGNQEASVDIIMRDTQGKMQGELRGKTIPSHGFYSTRNILESLGVTNKYGPVEIVSTNGQPLVVVSRVYSTSGTSGFFEGQPIQ